MTDNILIAFSNLFHHFLVINLMSPFCHNSFFHIIGLVNKLNQFFNSAFLSLKQQLSQVFFPISLKFNLSFHFLPRFIWYLGLLNQLRSLDWRHVWLVKSKVLRHYCVLWVIKVWTSSYVM